MSLVTEEMLDISFGEIPLEELGLNKDIYYIANKEGQILKIKIKKAIQVYNRNENKKIYLTFNVITIKNRFLRKLNKLFNLNFKETNIVIKNNFFTEDFYPIFWPHGFLFEKDLQETEELALKNPVEHSKYLFRRYA